MNFLAHVFLSGDDPDLLFGNYIGDFVKGNQHEQLPEAIQNGVLLHREIDTYTDNHPVVSQSKDRLRDKYRHYAGVIVDLYYDHYLASLWEQYHTTPLKQFTENAYRVVNERREHLPARAERTYLYMSRDNWMYHYRKITGIERALTGMAHRTRFNSRMDEAGGELRQHYDLFRQDFQAFIPDVRSFANQWIASNQ